MLKKLKHQGVTIVLYSLDIQGFKELPDGITFWITGINSSKFNNKLFGIEGGIVLSKVDRKIAELIESSKRSGPVLSARSAVVLLELMKNQKIDLSLIAKLSRINKLPVDSKPEQLISKKLCE